MIKIKLIERSVNCCWIYITGAEAISHQLQRNGYDDEEKGWGKAVCNDDEVIWDEVKLILSIGSALLSGGKRRIAEVWKIKETG
jgi:hypothetical protein